MHRGMYAERLGPTINKTPVTAATASDDTFPFPPDVWYCGEVKRQQQQQQ